MIEGLPFLLFAALCWAGVGAGWERAGKKNIGLIPLGFCVSLYALMFVMPFTPFRVAVGAPVRLLLLLVLTVGIAGILRQAGVIFVARGMSLGHASITWVMLQSSMIWPFVFAAVFWKEALRVWQWGGVVVILIGLGLGARKSTIMSQFVIETLLITIVGGLLGFVFAYGIVQLFPLLKFEEYVGVPSVDTWGGILVTIILGLVGLAAGFFPARRAASLQPVQALKLF